MPRKRRRYGTGSVFRRANGRWIAQVAYTGPDGRRHYRTRWRRTEDAARLALQGLFAELDGGRPVHDDGQPLDRWLSAWLDGMAMTVRASTVASYENHVRLHISPVLGGIPIGDLRASDVRRLMADRLAAGKSPATVQRIRTTLGMALAAAVRERIIERNVVSETRQPRVERQPVKAMTTADAETIRAAVAGSWVELPVRVWLGSGLRRGEVLGLDQADLMLDGGYVRVRRSKTAVRAVPVSEDAIAALRAAVAIAPRRGPGEPVFFGQRTGERMRGDSVTHALRELTGLTPHALRHGVASILVASGVHMRVVAEQLGHADPALTARVYAHVIPEQQADAARRLTARLTVLPSEEPTARVRPRRFRA